MDYFGVSIDDVTSLYEKGKQTLFETENTLNGEMLDEILSNIANLQSKVNYYEKLILRLGQIVDYNKLKSQNMTAQEVKKVFESDLEYLKRVEELYNNNLLKRDYMFGYPANMEEYSYITSYLRFLESKLYLMNNCGDPYQRGNYGMDSKEVEREIIKMFAQSFGLKDGEFWGYVTTGGTESNFWAIREGFNKYPNAKLYFSNKTHYSVEKFVYNNRVGSVYPYEVVNTNLDGSISVDDLKEKIENDQKSGYRQVILVLTWGTTKEGAIDDVKQITQYLISRNIEFYCHLDAALYGGIPANQESAPKISDLKSLNVDSISISLHKFLGTSRANGVLISLSRDKRKQIDYIGQEDSTMLGSRDFPPFSTMQRIKEFMYLKKPDHYIENVNYFKEKLKENNIDYLTFDEDKCNIFVINKPSDSICKKYQLTTFTEDKVEKAHIIIFPFHKKQIIDQLIDDIKKDTGK